MTLSELRAKLVERLARATWERHCGYGTWGHVTRPSHRNRQIEIGESAVSALSGFLAESGLRIVPVKATDEMIAAIEEAREDFRADDDLWESMIAAFPDILKENG